MTLQAPAISDLHAVRTSASKPATWVQGIGVRQVRLTCGLVMFTYIFSHFFNHALGNFSYSTMEWWLTNVHVAWWRIPIVNATLYAAAIMHLSLGLWALYQRRQLPLHGGRDYSARAGLKHSAVALHPFRRRAREHHVRPPGAELRN